MFCIDCTLNSVSWVLDVIIIGANKFLLLKQWHLVPIAGRWGAVDFRWGTVHRRKQWWRWCSYQEKTADWWQSTETQASDTWERSEALQVRCRTVIIRWLWRVGCDCTGDETGTWGISHVPVSGDKPALDWQWRTAWDIVEAKARQYKVA